MQYGIAGVLWYQGEANTRNAESYFDLTKRLVAGYRKNWEDDALPFFYVQLPNFSGEIYDLDREGKDGDWPALREQQRKALAIQGTAMAVAIDLGEDNDLHPLNKEGVGTRLALLAAKALYGLKSPCEGPQIMEAAAENKPEGRTTVLISCKNAEGGLCIKEGDKGKELLDFEAVDRNGRVFPLPAELAGSHIRLSCPMPREALLEIRYCYHNTNKGALIYNQEGFPMSPFVLQL
jgi:sialate O-acetylesterase